MEFIKMDSIEKYNKGLNILNDNPKEILYYTDKGIMTNLNTDSRKIVAINNIINTLYENNELDKYTIFVLISGLMKFFLIDNLDKNNYVDMMKIDNLLNLLKRCSLHDKNDDIDNVKEMFLSLNLANDEVRKRL